MARISLQHIPNKKWTFTINPGISPQGYGPQALMINDELHIIGGVDHDAHSKFNNETQKFEKLHDFDHDRYEFYYHRCVKV